MQTYNSSPIQESVPQAPLSAKAPNESPWGLRWAALRRWDLLILFFVSVLPHLYRISAPLIDYHYHRQVNTASIARNFHADGMPLLHPRITWDGTNRGVAPTEFPAYMWLLGLLWNVMGLGDIWGRILSVFFSGLTAVVLYKFLSQWMEQEAAFYGSLMFSWLPVEVYFGRTVQPEALALLCYASALWGFDRFLREESPKRFLWWALAACSSSVSVGLKLPYAHLWLLMAFLAWTRKGLKACFQIKIWALPVLAALPVAAWYRYTSIATALAHGQDVLPTSFKSLVRILEYTDHARILGYYSFYQLFSRFPEITTTYAGLVFFALGAWKFKQRRDLFPFLWWLGVVLYLIAGGGYTFYHEYTALPFALVNAAFLGTGFCVLKNKILSLEDARRARGWILLWILALGIPVHMALRIKHWYNPSYPFLLRAKQVTDRFSSPEDLFFCNNRASSLYLYYIERNGWSWDVREQGEARLGLFDAVTRQGAKYFLTEKDETFKDRKNPVARYFFDRFQILYEDKDFFLFRLHPLPASISAVITRSQH